MEGSSTHAASGWPPQHQRRWSVPAIVRLREHVDDLAVRAADEVHELELGDRTHSGERSAEGSADDRRLSNRSVDHALTAEAMNKSIGDFERAAINTNVFADAEDSGVALHLFPNAF